MWDCRCCWSWGWQLTSPSVLALSIFQAAVSPAFHYSSPSELLLTWEKQPCSSQEGILCARHVMLFQQRCAEGVCHPLDSTRFCEIKHNSNSVITVGLCISFPFCFLSQFISPLEKAKKEDLAQLCSYQPTLSVFLCWIPLYNSRCLGIFACNNP